MPRSFKRNFTAIFLFFILTGLPGVSWAIESSNEDDQVKRSQGCEIASKISSGAMTPGQMTAEETVSYNYLRASYPGEFAGCTAKKIPAPTSMSSRAEDYPYEGKVSYILDGRSFALASGQKFTMIGIRILEGKNSEAVSFLKKTLQGQTVAIRYDREKKDRYNRLQGYAYLGKEFINKRLIEEGAAVFESMPPNTSRDAVLNPPPAPSAVPAPEIAEEEEFMAEIQKQQTHTIYLVWGSLILAVIAGIALKKFFFR